MRGEDILEGGYAGPGHARGSRETLESGAGVRGVYPGRGAGHHEGADDLGPPPNLGGRRGVLGGRGVRARGEDVECVDESFGGEVYARILFLDGRGRGLGEGQDRVDVRGVQRQQIHDDDAQEGVGGVDVAVQTDAHARHRAGGGFTLCGSELRERIAIHDRAKESGGRGLLLARLGAPASAA